MLGLLGEGSNHGFALAKELSPGTDLGRILTVRRSLVYRALDRLVSQGFAVPYQTEPGDAGPTRTIHRISDAGAANLDRWLVEPVRHIRDVRVEFLLKLRLLERRGTSPETLVTAQRDALTGTIAGLSDRLDDPEVDVVDRWRAQSALAVSRFLDQLGS